MNSKEEHFFSPLSPTDSNSFGGFMKQKARRSIEGKAGIIDENISRALRSVETDDIRKNKRHSRLSLLRGIENIPETLQEVKSEITKNQIKKPSSREEQLKKWREEKLLKKQVELKARKPLFIVGGKKPAFQPLVFLSDSQIKKDNFISKIPRAFTGKLPRIPEVSSQTKPIAGTSKKNQPALKNSIKPAVCKSSIKMPVFKPSFAPARTAVGKTTVRSATKNAVKSGMDKSTLNATGASRPSFAPSNFVFSPSCFGSIYEMYEKTAKAMQKMSTPIKKGRKSEAGEKSNLLHKKSGLFSVHSSNLEKVVEDSAFCSSNSDKMLPTCNNEKSSVVDSEKVAKVDMKKEQLLHTHRRSTRSQQKINGEMLPSDEGSSDNDFKKEAKMNDIDIKKEQFLLTPRRSMRLQQKVNEKMPSSGLDSVTDNLRKDAQPNKHEFEKGVTLRTPRRSRRLQQEPDENVFDMNKTSVVESKKEIKSKKSQAEKLLPSNSPYRLVTDEYSTIFEESELSLENSPVVDLKIAPTFASQNTRLTEDFEKLSLRSPLRSVSEIENMHFGKRPSLLYTPVNKAKKSLIHVNGDLLLFSPDI